MRRACCLGAAAALLVPVAASGQDTPWTEDPAVEQRAQSVLEQMTLEQKVDLMTGEVNANYGFFNNAQTGPDIPAMQAADGPVGVRVSPNVRGGEATLLPSGPSLASTFDAERAFQYGRVLGVEAHLSDFNMMLAPSIDLLRDPFNPRAFETFSEDPLLTGVMGAADTNGMQSVEGVGATLKHYNLNTQEHRRSTVDVQVDERTLRELYSAPWERVIRDAHPASVMCAFTGVNGARSCESEKLLRDILKEDLGFKGFVMTDYGVGTGTVSSALGGLDMDQPGVGPGENGATSRAGTAYGGNLLEAVQTGQVPESVVDEAALRILRAMIGVGMFDVAPTIGELPVEEHSAFARETSAEGTVLLKNERRMLPVTNRKFDSIAVIGPDADSVLFGGGSPKVNKPAREVSPLEGIRNRAGEDVDVTFHHGVDSVGAHSLASELAPVPSSFLAPPGGEPGQGLRGEYFATPDLSGTPVGVIENDPIAARAQGFYTFVPGPAPRQPAAPPSFGIRWTGSITAPETRTYRLGLTAFGTGRVFIDGEQVVEIVEGLEHETEFFDLELVAGESRDIRIEYTATSPRNSFLIGSQVVLGWQHEPNVVQPSIQEAAQVAREADAAIVVVRTYESEGFVDRPTLRLPNDQGQLIREVRRRNPNTIVVLQSGGPVATTEWDERVPAIIENWYGGQEQGNAIADVLWGDVNPSGSLPVSFPRSDDETPITFRGDPLQYPEVNDITEYSEGVFIGYRGHEKFGVQPRWPFGHGVSYTSFRYSGLQTPRTAVDPTTGDATVSFTLTNTGPRRGTEIAQVYAGELPTDEVETSPKTLAGWARATLDPGESRRVTVTLDRDALSYWDVDTDDWVSPAGPVRVMVGMSSKNIRLRGILNLG